MTDKIKTFTNNVIIKMLYINLKLEYMSFSISTASTNLNNLSFKNSFLNLTNCEMTLKKQKIIPQNEYLHYFKIDWDLKNNFCFPIKNKTQTKTISYNLFSENGTLIDKKYCLNEKMLVKIPIDTKVFNLTLYNKYKESGLANNIFDPDDPFYTDRCLINKINNTEVTILGRRQLYQNLTLDCSKNCILVGIEDIGYVNCNCNITMNDEFSASITNSILKIITNVNIEILKCWHVVFIYVSY